MRWLERSRRIRHVRRLLQRTRLPSDQARTEAESELVALGEEAVAPLLAILRDERVEGVAREWQVFLIPGVMATGPLLAHLRGRPVNSADMTTAVLMGIVLLLLVVARTLLGGLRRESSGIQKDALWVLARIGSVRAMGALVDGTQVEWIRPRATKALHVVLPQVEAENWRMLNKQQRAQLYQMAASGDVDLSLAVVEALGRAAGSEAVTVLEQLASSPVSDVNREGIKEAAVCSLSLLKRRLAYPRTGRTLLRPSEAPSEYPQVLVRPAGGPTMDSGNLLRAADRMSHSGSGAGPESQPLRGTDV